MSDLGTLITRAVKYARKPNDEATFRELLPATLADLRAKRFLFSDETAKFGLPADVAKLTPANSGLPGDIMGLDVVTLIRGGQRYPMDQVPSIRAMRDLQTHVTITGPPYHWIWYDQALEVWPATTAATYEIEIDYHRDATRVEADVPNPSPPPDNLADAGDKIESDSPDAVTNEFFRTGFDLVLNRLLARAFTQRYFEPETGQVYQVIANHTEQSLMRDRDIIKLPGRQFRGYM